MREPSQLTDLSVRHLLSWHSPASVAIEAAEIQQEKARAWERRLSRLQGACGCEQGGLGLIVGVVICSLYVALRPGGWVNFDNVDLWAGVAVLFISTSIGKLLGLRIAKRQLRRAVREIRAEWAAQAQPGSANNQTDDRPSPASFSSICCGNLHTTSLGETVGSRR